MCAVLAMAGSCPPIRAELKPDDLYSAASKSIVTLEVETISGKRFVGNAFLAVGDRLAVTAWHVVHDARRVEARFSDGQRVAIASLVDKNEKLDLALLELETAERPRLNLASATPRIGSRVYLVGAPRGLDFSMSEGLISQIRTLDGVRYYQLSCPISPGDSGGPVLNDRGEAIGVVSWRKADAENVGFAIPCAEVERMNSTQPPVAWSQAIPASNLSAAPRAATPLVREAVTTEKKIVDGSFQGFQEFLASRAGQRVTVTVQESGQEKSFRFEVPKQTAE
jgi:hypothetical protein